MDYCVDEATKLVTKGNREMPCQPSAAGILERCSHCPLKKPRKLESFHQAAPNLTPINGMRPQLQAQSSGPKLASVVALVPQVVCLDKSMHYLWVSTGVCNGKMGFIWFVSADESLPSTGTPAVQVSGQVRKNRQLDDTYCG
jgi:hypothetical protein